MKSISSVGNALRHSFCSKREGLIQVFFSFSGAAKPAVVASAVLLSFSLVACRSSGSAVSHSGTASTAIETARETLFNAGVIYDPERDLIVVKKELLEEEPVYFVGYWVRSNLPEYDDL